jgi:hypothetical protein
LWILCAARPAAAQVDMNGPWTTQSIFGDFFVCSLDITQVGTSLGITGLCGLIGNVNLTGTINPATGSFSARVSGGTDCPAILMTLASASLDNRTFFAGFLCSGPNGSFQGAIQGARCGNGVVDAISGEECDIAVQQCCSGVSFACTFSPPGAFCGDGNQCTDDACDGAGTCVHTNRTGACDDDNECTSPDECIDGVCTTTNLPDNTACEDFNECTTESCQGGSCLANDVPDGTPCDDFLACYADETCQNGFCAQGDPVVCPVCEACAEPYGCLPNEFAGHNLLGPIEDSLQLKKKNGTNLTRWRWIAADAIDPLFFGDPLTSTGYELCIFDSSNLDPVTFTPSLLFAASLPAGSDWRQRASGFTYRNSANKVRLRLKAGDPGEAKIVATLKGVANPVQYLPPLFYPVEVQLRTAPGSFPPLGYTSIYFNPVTSTAEHYRGQNPEP